MVAIDDDLVCLEVGNELVIYDLIRKAEMFIKLHPQMMSA